MTVDVAAPDEVDAFLRTYGSPGDALRAFLASWPTLRFLRWHYRRPETVYLTGLVEFGESVGFRGTIHPLLEDGNGSCCVVMLEDGARTVYWVDLFAQGDSERVGRSCESVLLYIAYQLADMGLEPHEVDSLRSLLEGLGLMSFEECWTRSKAPSRSARLATLEWIRDRRDWAPPDAL